MKLEILAVWDDKAKAFNRPYFVPKTAMGVRGFIDEVNRADRENILHQHPDDFHLSHIGQWDEETGEFTNFKDQTILVRGRDAKREAA